MLCRAIGECGCTTDMLSTTIEHMNKDEVKGHSTVLLNVFTATLDY